VFNRSTCDDEECTLVDNVLTKRLVITLAMNRAGRIFVYFANGALRSTDKKDSWSTIPTPECYVLSLATAAECILAGGDPLNGLASGFALVTMAPH